VKSFSLRPVDQAGDAYTQAGGHPYELEDSFTLNTSTNALGEVDADTNVKDIRTELPPGLIGNPDAVPKCAPYNVTHADCSGASQVGVLTVYTSRRPEGEVSPVYNLVPPEGLAAQLGARFNNFVTVHIDAHVRTGSDYGVTAEVLNSSAGESVTGASVTLWGVPAEASHDVERACPVPGEEKVNEEPPCSSDAPLVPFLTDPTACGGPRTTTMNADSWQAPDSFVQASSEMPGFSRCERLSFTPQMIVQPESSAADSPSGLHVDLHVPQNEDPSGLAEADLKNAVVTLPQGVTVDPSGANELQACSPAEIELDGPEPAQCPAASKIGSVEIDTPLIDHPLDGGVYVAQQGNRPAQGANPFGSLLAIYIAVADPQTGVVVKLAGEVIANAITGQLTTSFLDNPQLPFEELKLDIFGGPRAPLATPSGCGTYTTTTSLTPFSAPESGPAATPSSSFAITSGAAGSACTNPLSFTPSLSAGATDPQAGGFTPFTTTVSREDGNQSLGVVQLHLPEGLVGKLSSVTPCQEPQASLGTCGPESEIGHTLVSAGLGPDPYTISGGRVFITGPYKGAPYGLSIAEPAKAGPFDIGSGPCDCVVVRSKIDVDPHTSALTVTSDPLPRILEGIPLQLKHVNVTIDRPGFTINPTNCRQLMVTSTITGEQGANAFPAVPFKLANCATLPFEPKLTALTEANTSKANGAYLHVKVTSGPGQANIGQVKVDLPRQLPSRLTTLQKACIATVFEASPTACPTGSVVGEGAAVTPLFKNALKGPAYLVSHGGEAFPDLEIVLHGEGITLDLVGNTDIKKGITSSTFKAVPDAPISSFDLVLNQGPHSALTAFLPTSANGRFCRQSLAMPTLITGQNGAVIKQTTRIAVSGCPAAHRSKATRKRKRHKRHA